MFKKYTYNDGEIIYSVVVPVYNQEAIIVKNLKSIINHTLGNFEIIMILDFCYDNTEKVLFEFLDNYVNDKSNLIQIKIFVERDKPLFETKCDNIGFKNSSGVYCLEIQADMEMTQTGYNTHLTIPFKLLNNVIAVSGRCAHMLDEASGIGKLGNMIEKSIDELQLNRNCFYVLETCNRGPLLLDRKKLEEMDYLNEEEYYLENSEHDLMIRAFLEKNYICGYVPIDFQSPLSDGSTRKRDSIQCDKYLINEAEKIRLKEQCSKFHGLNKYMGIWKKREPVSYVFSYKG
jgi:glycosyltransferase involved in cell wall biosynthesis